MITGLLARAYTQLAQAAPTPSPSAGSNPLQNKIKQEIGSGSNYYTLLNPTTTDYSVGNVVDAIITFILFAAGITATIYLLWAGIMYITSAGDEAKATKARQGILNAIIGIIVITLAFAIEKAVGKIFA